MAAVDNPTKGGDSKVKENDEAPQKFSPEEEAALLTESTGLKTEANALFSSQKYHDALAKYDEAVASCPNYLNYELAVLQSNISACHLKLEEWKEAMTSATKALDGLAKVDKAAAAEAEQADEEPDPKEGEDDDEVEDEIVSSGAKKAAPAPAAVENPSQERKRKRKEDVDRITAKALLRRARARSEAGGWQNLAGAEEDYKRLAGMTNLSPADARTVRSQLRLLPARTKAAQEQETAEMWGKLKQLGNGILKPFGLSTENFKMEKDEKTGGYSMNFQQSGNGEGSGTGTQ